mgnify:CR=1 FL=1
MTREEWRAYLLFSRTAGSLSAALGRQGRVVEWSILGASGLLGLGLFLPFVQINQLLIFSSAHSLLDIGISLFVDRDYLLSAVVIVFSALVPLAKLDTLYRIWAVKAADDPAIPRLLRWLDLFSKWSMLEVFVAAVMVFAIKASWLGSASAQPGLYFFAFSALLTMALTQRTKTAVAQYRARSGIAA